MKELKVLTWYLSPLGFGYSEYSAGSKGARRTRHARTQPDRLLPTPLVLGKFDSDLRLGVVMQQVPDEYTYNKLE